MTPKQLKELRAVATPETGNRIAEACEIVGCSRMDISRATEMTPQYISDVVNGRFTTITVDNARKFSEFFGCQIEDLFPSREAIAS